MIDSNNCGLWITSTLRSIELEASHEMKDWAELDDIKRHFSDILWVHAHTRPKGEALSHKVDPVLGWANGIKLTMENDHRYRLTPVGREVASFHARFLERGYQAYREQGGTMVSQALSLATRRSAVSRKLFEESLRTATTQLKATSRKPVDIPSLRTVCCCSLLQNGYLINDEEFDERLKDLCGRLYYKYSLLRASKSSIGYPFPGIHSGGSFYYFDIATT
jgi:hypothetical protein